MWNVALYGTETWKFRKVDQIYLKSSEIWCWRRMEKIRLADLVKNEEVLLGVKEETNILDTIKPRKASWIVRILLRNFLLKHGIGRKMEELGRRGRKRRRPVDNIKQKRRYWNFKEEALDRTFRRAGFGISYEPVARQTT